jgi:23S rRNA (guanosine2251-2'-O)-methyltransferase
MMENKTMYIYGKRAVYEALRSTHHVDHIFLGKEMQSRDLARFKNQSLESHVPFTILSKSQLQKYCGPVVHQGIVAQMPDYKYINKSNLLRSINDAERPLILVLDQIQDTHNMGAIIRTAELCGVTAIIIPEKTSADINPTVAKTSAGAIFHTNIYRTSNIEQTLDLLKAHNFKFAALMPAKKDNIYQTELDSSLVLLIGSEGAGLRKNLLAYCDLQISIPQMGKLDSLNASVSTAVVLFEIMRQREYT